MPRSETQTELYLQENHGNIQRFYDAVSSGIAVGPAFEMSLSKPDLIRMSRSRLAIDLSEEQEWDSNKILSVIEFLKESAEDYPEDHPIWSVR